MSTTARVLLGLLLGAAIGLILARWDGATAARDAAASGRTARRAIICFLVLLSVGAALAAIAAPALLSFLPRPDGLAASLSSTDADSAGLSIPASLGDWFTSIIPGNALAAAAASAMLPLVVFALFFGFAVARIDATRRQRLLELVQAIADVMIVIVRWVLWAAPLGVFALVLAFARAWRRHARRVRNLHRTAGHVVPGDNAAAVSDRGDRGRGAPAPFRRRDPAGADDRS